MSNIITDAETKISQLITNKKFIRELDLEGLTIKEQSDFLISTFTFEDIQQFYSEVFYPTKGIAIGRIIHELGKLPKEELLERMEAFISDPKQMSKEDISVLYNELCNK